MMCTRSYAKHKMSLGRKRGDFFGLDTEKMSARSRVAAALTVLLPVALSGAFLVVFMPQLWWVFTIYFWIALPALALLTGGVSGTGEARPPRISEAELERALLESIRDGGEVSAAAVAARTRLTVAEADRRLKRLAENGYIEVRVRGGAGLYSLWGADGGRTAP